MENLDDNTIEVTIIRDESDIITCEICDRELEYRDDRICDLCFLEIRRRKRNSLWLVVIIVFFFFYLLGLM